MGGAGPFGQEAQGGSVPTWGLGSLWVRNSRKRQLVSANGHADHEFKQGPGAVAQR